MALIRHRGTGHTRRVPDRSVPYFPDYDVVTDDADAFLGRQEDAESDESLELDDSDAVSESDDSDEDAPNK